MGQDPEHIREEIERTRQEMGGTMEAIGYKTDVKSRTRDRVTDTKDKITDKAGGLKDRVTGTVSDASDHLPGSGSGSGDGPGVRDRVSSATPDSREAKRRARRAKSVAQQNPLGLAIGSAAVGFLAGLVLPSTRIEDEKIGPLADQLKEEARSTGQEALERGKQVAQEITSGDTKEAAQEAAKEAARESVQGTVKDQAQGMKESLKDSAENVQDAARS